MYYIGRIAVCCTKKDNSVHSMEENSSEQNGGGWKCAVQQEASRMLYTVHCVQCTVEAKSILSEEE